MNDDKPKWTDLWGIAPNFNRHPVVEQMTAFLTARIETDEAVAHDMRHQAASGRPLLTLNGGGTGIRSLTDPDRILRECAAKRAVILDVNAYGDIEPMVKAELLYAMAQVYADHEDFSPAWIYGKTTETVE